MKKITIPSLYAMPGLYDLVLNKNKSFKLGEATAAAWVFEGRKERPRSIIELFSGVDSYHLKYFKEAYSYTDEVERFACLDQYANPQLSGSGVVCKAVDEPWGDKFDAAVAYYFPLASCMDTSTGRVTRSYVLRCLQSIRRNLNPGGFLLLDVGNDGSYGNLGLWTTMFEDNGRVEEEIWHGHPLTQDLAKHGVTAGTGVKLVISCEINNTYDRLDGNHLFYVTSVRVHAVTDRETVHVADIKISEPLAFRYWSESETVDLLTEAGFTNLEFFKVDYLDHDFNTLDVVEVSSSFTALQNDEHMDQSQAVSDYSANLILGYVK